MFVISYNVTLLDQKKSPKVDDTPNITTGKKWWEVYGEEKRKEIKDNMHKTIKQDKRFDKAEEPIDKVEEIEPEVELPKPLRGQFSRVKKS